MTTPNFNTTGGYNSGTSSTTDTGTSNVARSNTNPGAGSNTGRTDDVSFSHGNTGSQTDQSTVQDAKNTVKRGVQNAEDAMGQLQQKASDLTSRLISNVDVDDLTQKLEQQVRDHPTRTLLAAIGAGFLLGRTAKR